MWVSKENSKDWFYIYDEFFRDSKEGEVALFLTNSTFTRLY